eukprot:jgi/Bigna1/66840/fgenesh1_pg.2_\
MAGEVVTIFPLPVSLLLLLFVQCASPHSPHWVTADASAAGVAGKSDVGLQPVVFIGVEMAGVPLPLIANWARQSLADWIAMRKQAMRFSRVWVTILTEENDMPGVVALSESLVRTGSIFPLTVLVSQRINATLRNQLYRHPGVGHVIEMEDLSPATDNENWGLLHAFGLTQYSAVCVLSPKTLQRQGGEEGEEEEEDAWRHRRPYCSSSGSPPRQGCCGASVHMWAGKSPGLAMPVLPASEAGGGVFASLRASQQLHVNAEAFLNDYFKYHPEITGIPDPAIVWKTEEDGGDTATADSANSGGGGGAGGNGGGTRMAHRRRGHYVGFERAVSFSGLPPWAVTEKMKLALALCDHLYEPDVWKCSTALQQSLLQMKNGWLKGLRSSWWGFYNDGMMSIDNPSLQDLERLTGDSWFK